MMEKERYTIEDLRTGKVGLAFKKNEKKFSKIVKLAFPEDTYWNRNTELDDLVFGEEFVTYDPDNEGSFLWQAHCHLDIPYATEIIFILPDDVEKETWDDVYEIFCKVNLESNFTDYTTEDFVIFLKDNYKCKVKKIK